MAIVNGYAGDADEVTALLADSFDAEDYADPTLLYVRASKLLALHQTMCDRLAEIRCDAVQRFVADGLSYQQIADRLGLSKGRVQQMVGRASHLTARRGA